MSPVIDSGKNEGVFHRQSNPGQPAFNVLRIALDVADTETVTIGADTYEFDRAADGVVAGNIAVVGHADDTPANASDALITAINTLGTEPVKAIDISANEILLVSAGSPGGDEISRADVLGCTETLAGANNAWAAAAMADGEQAGKRKLSVDRRSPNAQEVVLGMHFVYDAPPTVLAVLVYAADLKGAARAWDGAYAVTGNRVTLDAAGAAPLLATDFVVVIASS